MIREENINCTVEALILASPEPVSIKRLSETIDEVSPARIRQAVDDLNNVYMGCGNSFRIREVAGGYQVHILPDFEQPIKRLLVKQRTVRLSRAALEALAIIAYKQPVTKIEIEHIRGVASDGVIHNLLQRQLVVISGRSESAGRPLLYKTSNEFLKFFGLNRLSDLPRMDEIEEMIRMAETPKEQTVLEFAGKKEDFGDEEISDGESPEVEFLGEETADEEMNGDTQEPGNGHRENGEFIVSADVSDFINNDEDDMDFEEHQDLPGGNGTDADDMEDDLDVEDEIETAEPLDLNEEPESKSVGGPDNGNGRSLPAVIYYEPLPDKPPGIFVSDEIPAMASEGGNGTSGVKITQAPEETSAAVTDSSEPDETPADN